MLDFQTRRDIGATFSAQNAPSVLTQPALGARPVETNGWDVVSAIQISDMNDAIENAGRSPKAFEQTLSDGTYVRGTFAPWRVGPDGDGHLINLDIGLRDVEIRKGDAVTTLGEALAMVRVHLELMPTGRKGLLGASPSETQALVIKTHVDQGMLMADPDAKVATLLEIDGTSHLGALKRASLMRGLEAWLNENIHQFQHVFATVNVVQMSEEDAEGQAFSWMKPTSVSYAFGRNSVSPEDSVLAILCQTGGRKADGLVHQAQADIIPQGANAAFVISKRRLIRDMILPGLANAFDGLKTSDFRLRKADTGISLKKPAQLKSIKDKKGKEYDPIAHKLDIIVHDTDLRINSVTKTEVTPGVRSVCTAASTHTFGLTTQKGKKTIGYITNAKDPIHETERDPAVDIVDWILKIGGMLFGILAIALTGGAALIAAGVCAACLAGEITIKVVEDTKRKNGPPIDLLVSNATTAVSWSTGARFDPTFAALNGGLQIGGMLTAPKTQSLMQSHVAFQDQFSPLMGARRTS